MQRRNVSLLKWEIGEGCWMKEVGSELDLRMWKALEYNVLFVKRINCTLLTHAGIRGYNGLIILFSSDESPESCVSLMGSAEHRHACSRGAWHCACSC